MMMQKSLVGATKNVSCFVEGENLIMKRFPLREGAMLEVAPLFSNTPPLYEMKAQLDAGIVVH